MTQRFCIQVEVVWIPVEDELPEYELPVLFWIAKDVPDNRAGCYVGYYSHKHFDGRPGRWFDVYGHNVYSGVTHWTPLPQGPDCQLLIGLELEDGFG